jgi:hypothetical protein
MEKLTEYRVSLFLGNTLYLLAFGYYTVITFLGYNGKFPPACLTYFY